jgi:broad specificity phosphatase PhoE
MTQKQTIIHFVRHGEVHNPTSILYGRLPRYRLSERGIGQAKAAGEFLKDHPLTAVYHSPMLRARQTAEQIAAPHGLKPRQSTLLNEIHTPYQGTPVAQLDAMGWRLYDDIEPSYEQPSDLVQRIERFVQQMRNRHAGEEIVAVTHGDIVLHARMWAEGKEPTYENRAAIQPYPITASLNTITFTDGDSRPAFRYTEPY